MSFRYLGRHVTSLRRQTCILLIHILVVAPSWAEPVAVIYPEVREAYKKVFLNIADGAEKELGQDLLHLEISEDSSTARTKAWLDQNNVSAVIALGNKSIEEIGPDLKFPTVIGAVVFQPGANQYAGISLNPAPDRLFSGLQKLLPKLNTIHVVYDPDRNQWEVEAATELAEIMGITVNGYPANDLRQAATAYRDIQEKMNSDTDAVWLPLGGPARDKAILQNILETAWTKKQAVISSNLADVKRGVLFAMYPDNVGMGEDLGKLLKEVLKQSDGNSKIHFTTALFQAINRRTAEHLDMRLSQDDLSHYHFIYPPR